VTQNYNILLINQLFFYVFLSDEVRKKRKTSEEKTIPVSFYEECISRIQEKLGINLIKQSRISFTNKDKSIGLTCAISKPHKQGQHEKFWFAFHPHQNDFLKSVSSAYVAYGCGSSDKLFLIPYNEFEVFIKNFWTTENEDRMYWHVVIHDRNKKFFMAQPQIEKGSAVDITKYKI
jgi:hypothetical protein